MNNIFMAWLSPIHPPPVVFGVLKTPTRPRCAFQDASQIPFLGAKKSKNWGAHPTTIMFEPGNKKVHLKPP